MYGVKYNDLVSLATIQAMAQQRQLGIELKEGQRRYDDLIQTNHELKMSCDGTISSLATDVKLKAFELERSQLVVDELQSTALASSLETEKLRSKIEVITKEYYELKTMSESKIGVRHQLIILTCYSLL